MSESPPVLRSRVVINCSNTRYHVVRSAAASKGWTIEDGAREEPVPASFHGVDLTGHTLHTAPQQRTEAAVGERSQGSLKGVYDPDRSPQVVWVDRSVVPGRVRALQPHQRVNHFPGMDCIARKATLFKRLMRIRRACVEGKSTCQGGRRVAPPRLHASSLGAVPAASAAQEGNSGDGQEAFAPLRACVDTFYPRSFSSLTDLAALQRFIAEEASAADYFIVKPNKGCQGRGIRLSRRPTEVLKPEETAQKDAECLVQCYVDRPLLIEGHKFDLRLYVLLTSLGPSSAKASALSSIPPELRGLHLYIHEEGLVRMCAAPYEAPSDANCERGSAHLTNYAVNKRESEFSVAAYNSAEVEDSPNDEPLQPVDSGHKRDFCFMRRFINGLPSSSPAAAAAAAASGGGERWLRVKRRIAECVALTVLSGAAVLRRELAGAQGTPRSCFELLGFDVMLHGDTLEPVLMEVNHSPSLFCDTDFDFHVKQRVLRDTLALVQSYTPSRQQQREQRSRPPRAVLDSAKGTAAPEEVPACVADPPEEVLIRRGEVRYAAVLPNYRPCGEASEGGQDLEDWTPEERARQVQMVRLGGTVL